jgi:hypothetical protein
MGCTQSKKRANIVNLMPSGLGPFKILEVFSNNTYRLQDLEGNEVFSGPINGHFLKKCFL